MIAYCRRYVRVAVGDVFVGEVLGKVDQGAVNGRVSSDVCGTCSEGLWEGHSRGGFSDLTSMCEKISLFRKLRVFKDASSASA